MAITKAEFMACTSFELGKKTGIPHRTWYRYFSGERCPNLVQLQIAALELGIPVSTLVDWFLERLARDLTRK